MSDRATILKRRNPIRSLAPVLLAATAAALLAGCANRDSITVGSVPDDYRTNHPIMIGEKEEVLDIAVAASDRRASRPQREAFAGFLDRYDRSAAPVLTIMPPAGALNSLAAGEVARDLAQVARQQGVPASRIALVSYQADTPDSSAPVRVSYVGIRAHTDKCGRWPADLADTTDNKHYANFGCSYQNNIAAQIANPNDLMGPRKQTTIDAENRSRVIDDYRNNPADATFSPETSYEAP